MAAGKAAESSFLAGASNGKNMKDVKKAKQKTACNKKEEHDFEDDSTKLALPWSQPMAKMRKITRLRRLLAKRRRSMILKRILSWLVLLLMRPALRMMMTNSGSRPRRCCRSCARAWAGRISTAQRSCPWQRHHTCKRGSSAWLVYRTI